jgi:hypothetical protein
MTADDVFRQFVARVLVPAKAERLDRLIGTPRGNHKALETMYHHFIAWLKPELATPKRQQFWSQECFVFRPPRTFGERRTSFAVAYDELSTTDSWLIVSADGKFGIHRPEGEWDQERTIAA